MPVCVANKRQIKGSLFSDQLQSLQHHLMSRNSQAAPTSSARTDPTPLKRKKFSVEEDHELERVHHNRREGKCVTRLTRTLSQLVVRFATDWSAMENSIRTAIDPATGEYLYPHLWQNKRTKKQLQNRVGSIKRRERDGSSEMPFPSTPVVAAGCGRLQQLWLAASWLEVEFRKGPLWPK